jgi:hypothetical protein
MTDDIELDEAPERPTQPAPVQPVRSAPELPDSIRAERLLLSRCMEDRRHTDRAARVLTAAHFTYEDHALIWQTILESDPKEDPFEQLVTRLGKQISRVGGIQALIDLSHEKAAPGEAPGLIAEIQDSHARRQALHHAARITEMVHQGADLEAIVAQASRISQPKAQAPDPARGLFEFTLPADTDSSVLLGNRYLSRGDGAILSSTSGMGKSSLSLQAATAWALGKPLFGGFKPNGPLKSLIFQAEDTDGDIAEVRYSLAHAMKLTDAEQATVNQNVKVITERTRRGLDFIAEVRRQVDLHKPEILWINPLLAFIDGNVNDAEDTGAFLRGGLNSLNDPTPRFAIIVIHHTAKPPKEKAERKWNEVMYSMAGSADLTNWARAIISLEAGDERGQFNLILAKRGQRAELVRDIPQGAGTRQEIVTTVGLCHSTERFTPPGSKREIPVIHWQERAAIAPVAPEQPKSKGGRASRFTIEDFISVFPLGAKAAKPFAEIHRSATTKYPVTKSVFFRILKEAANDGMILTDFARGVNNPRYYIDGPVEPKPTSV